MATTAQKVGGEFVVNTTTADAQFEPTITALSDGRFIVAWTDFSGVNDSSYGIKGQMFNADASRAGVEFVVNTTIADTQAAATVTALSSGRFVVAWADGSGANDSGQGIKAQVFNADGSRAGAEFVVNTTIASPQRYPTLTALSDGRFVAAWEDLSGVNDSASGIKAQVFKPDGSKAGAEFVVNTTTMSVQYNPTITALSDGRFVAAWEDASGFNDNGYGIKAQVFYSDGSKAGGEFVVNTTIAGGQYDPAITALSDGRFVVTWDDYSGVNDSDYGIKAQVFNANGTKAGAEFVVNTTITGSQKYPTLTALSDGRFVAAWADGSGVNDSGTGIKAQVFNVDGSKAGAEFVVNTTTTSVQQYPTLTALSDGRFAVAWTDQSGVGDSGSGIKAQVFQLNDDPVAVADRLVTNEDTPLVVKVADLIANDRDSYKDTFAITAVGSLTGGTAVLDTKGTAGTADDTVTFTPGKDFSGQAGFTYTLTDAGGLTATGTVTVEVKAINDAPVQTGQQPLLAAGTEDKAYTVTAADLFAGYTDADGDALSVTGLTADCGTVAANGDGSFTITPEAGFSGTLRLTYAVTDGMSEKLATQSVVFSAEGDAPTITANGGGETAALTLAENKETVAVLTAEKGDDAFSWSIAGGADAGLFTIDAATGLLAFKAAPDFEAPTDAGRNGVYDVIVRASDGTLGDTQALAIKVTNAPGLTKSGTAAADRLDGTGEEDRLSGVAGNDTLRGAGGADRLEGGAGADKLSGGAGADTFVYAKLSDSTATGRDTIFDFEKGDRIDLSAIDASTKASGNQAFAFIGTAAFHGKAGELRYEKQASDTYLYADVNGDGKADFALHLDDAVALGKGDFLL